MGGMRKRSKVLFVLLSSAFCIPHCGCLSDDKKLTTVSANPFRNASRTQTASFKQAPQATQEIALRVDRVGKSLVNANPRINQKVAFLTLGINHEEIFHQTQKDVSTVYVTEELAKQCKTDGELAAVLSEELGKLVTEQMVQTRPSRGPIPAVLLTNPRIGNDVNGTFGSPDGTDQLINAHLEKDWQRGRQTLPLPPPPPETLARIYLKSAGFDPKDLDKVAPLLRKAEKQSGVEQSMTGKQSG
ncbi:MAG: M48 family metalloprotease [Gemmataceae bacterium]